MNVDNFFKGGLVFHHNKFPGLGVAGRRGLHGGPKKLFQFLLRKGLAGKTPQAAPGKNFVHTVTSFILWLIFSIAEKKGKVYCLFVCTVGQK